MAPVSRRLRIRQLLPVAVLVGCGARSGLGGTSSDRTEAGTLLDSGRLPRDGAVADSTPFDGGVPPGCAATWLWTSQGEGRDTVNAVAPTSDGGIVAVGEFGGTLDFGLGANERRTATGYSDAFVVKLDCRGAPVWVRAWGGDGVAPFSSGWDDDVEDVAVDRDGSIYVVGQFCSTVDFDPGPGEDVRTSGGCFDGYVTRLGPDGTHVWTRTFGSVGRDRVSSVALTVEGNVAVAGQFEDTVDFDPGPKQLLRQSAGEIDDFVLELTTDGGLVWVDTWGGPLTELGPVSLTAYSDGALLVTGPFQDRVDFDPGPSVDIRASRGMDDIYITKLDGNGGRTWTRTFGGLSNDDSRAILYDGYRVSVAGHFYGEADFDPGRSTDLHSPGGLYDAFLTHLDVDGGYVWSRTWGQTAVQIELSVASTNDLSRMNDNTIVVGGQFAGTIDFGAGGAADLRTAAGQNDGFVTAFSDDGTHLWTWTYGGSGWDGVSTVSVVDSALVVAGPFQDTVTFDFGSEAKSVSARNDYDGYVARLDPTRFR